MTWTVNGAPASETACAPRPSFAIEIRPASGDRDDQVSYSPVPCVQGQFTVDKLPTTFGEVVLRVGGDQHTLTLDATGGAAIDLRL